MNDNIVKMQIFHKIKSDLRGHSRSQIMAFLIKNWLIDWMPEITKFDLYKDNICLVLNLTYVLMDNFLSLFFIVSRFFSWSLNLIFKSIPYIIHPLALISKWWAQTFYVYYFSPKNSRLIHYHFNIYCK